MAPQCPGTIGLLRLPWGQRLRRFGVLGLLDEDPTEGGWFGAAPRSSEDDCSSLRCVRVLTGSEDASVRLREAYRSILLGVHLNEALQEAS